MQEPDSSKDPDIMRRSRGESSLDCEIDESAPLALRGFKADKADVKGESFFTRWCSCFCCCRTPEEEPLVTSTVPVPKK